MLHDCSKNPPQFLCVSFSVSITDPNDFGTNTCRDLAFLLTRGDKLQTNYPLLGGRYNVQREKKSFCRISVRSYIGLKAFREGPNSSPKVIFYFKSVLLLILHITTPAPRYTNRLHPTLINYGTMIHNWKKPDTSATRRLRKFVNSTFSFFIFLKLSFLRSSWKVSLIWLINHMPKCLSIGKTALCTIFVYIYFMIFWG